VNGARAVGAVATALGILVAVAAAAAVEVLLAVASAAAVEVLLVVDGATGALGRSQGQLLEKEPEKENLQRSRRLPRG